MSRAPDARPKGDNAAARVTQIKAAARKIFRAEGYNGARMDLIAKAVGMSVGGLYLYFDSKEDLFSQLLSDDLSRVTPDKRYQTVLPYLPFPTENL